MQIQQLMRTDSKLSAGRSPQHPSKDESSMLSGPPLMPSHKARILLYGENLTRLFKPLQHRGWTIEGRKREDKPPNTPQEQRSIVLIDGSGEEETLNRFVEQLYPHVLLVILLFDQVTEANILNAHRFERIAVLPRKSEALVEIIDLLSARASRHQQDLSESTRTLALQKMGQLSSGLSHQIRNPLNAAMLQLELLARRAPEGEAGQQIKNRAGVIRNEIDRLSRILNEFLAIARPFELSRNRFSLSSLFHELLSSTSALLEASNAEVELSIDSKCDEVNWDRARILEAFSALLSNAAEAVAANGGGCITISACAHEEGIELRFQDDGPGFDEMIRAKAIDPFTTTKRGGRGLGLPLAERVIDLHHGALAIQSGQKGATIVLKMRSF